MSAEDIYLELCEKTIESFVMRCNCQKEDIGLQSQPEALTKGNLALFGHILFDMHEQYHVPMTYAEFSQFQTFPTVEAVVNHFYENIN